MENKRFLIVLISMVRISRTLRGKHRQKSTKWLMEISKNWMKINELITFIFIDIDFYLKYWRFWIHLLYLLVPEFFFLQSLWFTIFDKVQCSKRRWKCFLSALLNLQSLRCHDFSKNLPLSQHTILVNIGMFKNHVKKAYFWKFPASQWINWVAITCYALICQMIR